MQSVENLAPETKSSAAAGAAAGLGTLLRHSSHYLGGRLGLMMLGFISFPLFTRIFTVAEYGEIDLVLKIVLMVTVLSKLGIQHSVLRLYDEHATSADPEALRRYQSTFFLGSLLAAAPLSCLYWVVIHYLAPTLPPQLASLLYLSCVLVFTGAVRSILVGFLRAQQRTHLYNVLEILTKAATLACTCALLFGWHKAARSYLIGSIWAELSGVIVMSVIIGRGHMIRITAFCPALLKRILAFGVPLIGYEFANILLDSGDRTLVQYYLGSTALGYYSAAYNIAGYVHELLMNPVNLAIFPIYVKLWNTQGPKATSEFLSSGLEVFLWAGISMIGIAWSTSEEAVRLLASPKYVSSHGLIPVLVPAFVLFAVVLFLQAGLCLHNRTVLIAKITIATAAANVGLNILLLKPLGIWGAALATFGGYLLLAVLTARASMALLPIRINYAGIGRCLVACTVGWAVSYRIDTGLVLLTLAVKAAVYFPVYAGILYVWDQRFRGMVRDTAENLWGPQSPRRLV